MGSHLRGRCACAVIGVLRARTSPATATFAVTASGTAPLQYQWQAATPTADSGATFRVVVTNAAGSARQRAQLLLEPERVEPLGRRSPQLTSEGLEARQPTRSQLLCCPCGGRRSIRRLHSTRA